MLIHQIRNATIIVTYKEKKFLIDPWLMPKDFMPGFEGAVNAAVRQPRVELPLPIKDIVNADAVILTHFHPDHWDEFAAGALNKNIPFFVQNNDDAARIRAWGFNNISILCEEGCEFSGITLFKTHGQHGKREIVKPICEQIGLAYDAKGIIFKAETEKTLYIAGDTIWCEEVMNAIDKFSPEVIVVNACGAALLNGERIIMDNEDVRKLADYSSSAAIIASHMDTVSHLTVTRNDIKKMHIKNVFVPEDNECLEF